MPPKRKKSDQENVAPLQEKIDGIFNNGNLLTVDDFRKIENTISTMIQWMKNEMTMNTKQLNQIIELLYQSDGKKQRVEPMMPSGWVENPHATSFADRWVYLEDFTSNVDAK